MLAKKIEELDLSLNDLKTKVVTPILCQKNDDLITYVAIRKVVVSLLTYNSGNPTRCLIKRGKILRAIPIVIFGSASILFIIAQIKYGISITIVDCDVHLPNRLQWIGNFTKFVCKAPAQYVAMRITYAYGTLLCVDAFTCYRGLMILLKVKTELKLRKCYGSKDFADAGRSMLFLAKISTGGGEEKLGFADFVKFLFEDDTINLLERAIPQACGFYGSQTNEELVYLYAGIAGKSRTKQLTAGYKEQIPHLIEKKKWKSIVILLNFLPGPFRNTDLLSDIISTPNDSGNNILYYALDRKPGFTIIHTEAAEFILKNTTPSQRIVLQDQQETSAVDFIQAQFNRDPTYPEDIRDELLQLATEN